MIDLLKKWLGGAVNWKEEKQLRKQAETDTFLADAMEGYDQLPIVNHSEKLVVLQERLQKKQGRQQTKKIPYIGRAIAASIALLLSVGLFFLVQERIQHSPALSEQSLQKSISASDIAMENMAMEDMAMEKQSAPLVAKKRPSPTLSEPITSLQNETDNNKRNRQISPPSTPKPSQTKPIELATNQEATTISAISAAPEERKISDQKPPVRTTVEQGKLAAADKPAISAARKAMKREAVQTESEALSEADGVIMIEEEQAESAAVRAQSLPITKTIDPEVQAEDETPSILSRSDVSAPAAPEMDSKVEELMATPVGGLKKFNRYIKKSIKYPTARELLPVKGAVVLNFSIDKNGQPMDIKVVQGLAPAYNQEAIRLLKEGPKWNSNGALKGVYEVIFEEK